MGKLIKIKREEVPPMVKCPKCQSQFQLDITQWKNDCGKILMDNCPKCRAELFVGVLILVHPTHTGLLECIKRVVSALNPGTFLKL